MADLICDQKCTWTYWLVEFKKRMDGYLSLMDVCACFCWSWSFVIMGNLDCRCILSYGFFLLLCGAKDQSQFIDQIVAVSIWQYVFWCVIRYTFLSWSHHHQVQYIKCSVCIIRTGLKLIVWCISQMCAGT